MNYLNNQKMPFIQPGDLADYQTVRAGIVKVKVLELKPRLESLFLNAPTVRVRVTSRSNPYFHYGYTFPASPLWLNFRARPR